MIKLSLGQLLHFDNWLRGKPEHMHLSPKHTIGWVTRWERGMLQGEETERAYAHWLLER